MIEFVVGLVMGMALGAWLLASWIHARLVKFLNSPELQAELEESKPSSTPELAVKIEQAEGQYFFYDVNDGRFLAHGRDLDEISNKIDQLMNGRQVLVRVVEGDPDVIRRFQKAS